MVVPQRSRMRVVIVGGTGLIGRKLVAVLRESDHEAVDAAPSTGVNALTGEGLTGALRGADVVVDVSNSPSFDDAAVLEFFTTSTRNLLEAGRAAGVRHHVALSVVGTARLQESGYFCGKAAQERLIREGPLPYTIVQATQFFEFVNSIAASFTRRNVVALPAAGIQPMAADDVASMLARIAVGEPANGTVEIAGPQEFRLDELVRLSLSGALDPREVMVDPEARYFGARLKQRTLLPDAGAHLSTVRFDEWRARTAVG